VRFIGSSSGFIHPMHIHGGPCTVVARDGETLSSAACYQADTVNVGPGQRYDVIWPARKAGQWLIHCHLWHHTANNNTKVPQDRLFCIYTMSSVHAPKPSNTVIAPSWAEYADASCGSKFGFDLNANRAQEVIWQDSTGAHDHGIVSDLQFLPGMLYDHFVRSNLADLGI